MSKVEYDQPLEYYTVDNFIKESEKLIGKHVQDIYSEPVYETVEAKYINSFAYGHGDNNPLFSDLTYALDTRWKTLIAPPTFLITIRFPISYGALYDGPYPLIGVEAGFNWEWFDVIRMKDQLTGDLVLKDVDEETSKKFNSRVVYLLSEARYFNKITNELVAKCFGKFAAVARAESITEIPEFMEEGFKNHPITDRTVYRYSEEELIRLTRGIRGETRRGYRPLYWEDVNIDDTLTPVVKGPMTLLDLMHYHRKTFSSKAFPVFEAQFRKGLKTPGFLRTNPATRWPYDPAEMAHLDPHLSEGSGFPNIFAHGTLRADMYTHLLSNWIGDDGFIRRLNVDTLEPHIYGDTLWLSGKVVKKYNEMMWDKEYGAVDITLEAVNQLGQDVSPGTATVYLPSPGRSVELPVPL